MNKSIVITLIVFVALVIVYAFTTSGEYTSTVPEGETAGLASFKKIDFDEVGKITIAKGEAEPVELQKDAEGWKVATRWNYEADEKKVDEILESLGQIKGGERAGKSRESHRDFEVDKRKGGFIRLYGEDGKKELGDIVVGKSAQSADFRTSHVFLRFNDEDVTYNVQSDIRSKANLWSDDVEAKRYLQTKIFELDDSDELRQVRLVREGKDDLIVERRYRLKEEEKKEEEEKDSSEDKENGEDSEEKKEPEKEEFFVVTSGHETHEVGESEKWSARGLVDRAKTIRVEDAAEPKELAEYGLAEPRLIAVASFRKKDDEDAEPSTITLLFGNAYKGDDGEDKGYYFNLKGAKVDDRIYKIQKWDFESWQKELKDFLPKPKKEEKKEEEKKEKEEDKKKDEEKKEDDAEKGEEEAADSPAEAGKTGEDAKAKPEAESSEGGAAKEPSKGDDATPEAPSTTEEKPAAETKPAGEEKPAQETTAPKN